MKKRVVENFNCFEYILQYLLTRFICSSNSHVVSFYQFYSSADNLVRLIYENSRVIGFEQISGHLGNKKHNSKKISLVPGPADCKLQVRRARLDHTGLNANRGHV